MSTVTIELDTSDLAAEVAEAIDKEEIASCIDASDVAMHVELDSYDVEQAISEYCSDNIDHDDIAASVAQSIGMEDLAKHVWGAIDPAVLVREMLKLEEFRAIMANRLIDAIAERLA